MTLNLGNPEEKNPHMSTGEEHRKKVEAGFRKKHDFGNVKFSEGEPQPDPKKLEALKYLEKLYAKKEEKENKNKK
jgi:hypothetical protein